MGLVSQPIKNFKGGISQQPDILRFPNQGETQINGWSSESQGLQKRPPSVFLKRLGSKGAFGAAPLIHLVNRDAVEQYYMVFTGTGVIVYDLAGNAYTVRGYDGYANTDKPRERIRLLSVADYTFVVNRDKRVGMSDKLTHASYGSLTRRALIVCRGGQYGRRLRVMANSTVLADYQLPDGLNTDAAALTQEVEAMDAQKILGVLAGQVNAKTSTTNITATVGQGYMVLTHPTAISTVYTEDGYADQLLSSLIYQVQSTNKLPISAPNGYLVEITGESSRSGDNYWVMYDGVAKVWKETVRPGIIAGFDAATMPRALVRAADGQFDWKVLAWTERGAGDDTTNPMPTLIDQTINDVFFFRNRLGFLAGENVVMSRTSRYFSFFPPSVASISDDDPIDVAVSHNRISILKYAVPFSEQLLLWSDQAQFVLSSSGILSAKTAELNLTTEFDVQDSARPFGIGRGVYFSAPRASFTSLKRYYAVQDVSDVKSAEDVSSHVPSYIANKVYNIAGSGTENYVTALSDGAQDRLYLYKFLYIDENIAQQSWSHWEFGGATRVLACASIGSYMYLILEKTEGILLERIEFTQFTVDFPQEPYRTFVDGKVSHVCSSYDEDLNESYIPIATLYGATSGEETSFWSIDPDGVATLHEYGTATMKGLTHLVLIGDRRGTTFVVGRQYRFTYECSKFLIKQIADDGSTSTEDIGRLQLRKVWFNYERSGSFVVNVDNGQSLYEYIMAGGRLGGEIKLGSLSLGTGQHRFSVTGNAVKQRVILTSDNPQPCNIVGGGFEGNYVRRSSGI